MTVPEGLVGIIAGTMRREGILPQARQKLPHTRLDSRNAKIRKALYYNTSLEHGYSSRIAKELNAQNVTPTLVSAMAQQMRKEGIQPPLSKPYPYTDLNSETARIRKALYYAKPEDRGRKDIARKRGMGVSPEFVTIVDRKRSEERILPQTDFRKNRKKETLSREGSLTQRIALEIKANPKITGAELAKKLNEKPDRISSIINSLKSRGHLPKDYKSKPAGNNLDEQISEELDRRGITDHDERMRLYMQEVDRRTTPVILKRLVDAENMIESEEAKVQSLINLKKKSQAARLIFRIAELKRAIKQAKNLTSVEKTQKLIEKAVQQFRQK